eukprot:CAMPEP_0202691070 /NCGR_PEP_ID=MMETSP1385-20130828/5885_1 /ASSEMBLY_ACC=CAM_ASM_000861 /TAXON_ID=933848 /ORGANISM="Elphidium margaritaceum" /LENGTH=485 /DNA_ID=CAMNT_0049346415 /DNA_START=46 /DNA_END=1503 /DNA_ORIENTATION=+
MLNTLFRRSWRTAPQSQASLIRHCRREYIIDFKKEPFQARPGRRPIECDTPLEAVECIRSNSRVFVHGMCATPELLIHALCEHAQANDLRNIEMVHLLTTGTAPQVLKYKKHFTDTSLFVSDNVRNAVDEGYADYVPIFLSEIPLLFIKEDYVMDAALIQVSPPDRSGYCSLGVSVDIARAAIAGSNQVIGLINRHMPRSHGEGHVHISHFDYVYEHHTPLSTFRAPQKTMQEIEAYKTMASLIATELIEDAATIQVGIGEISKFMYEDLKNHRNLGIHTELIGDGILPLLESGAVTNSHKREHPGKTICTFVMGSKKVFDLIDDNPSINLLETNYVNDIGVISSNPNVVAVNSALEIDITGQVVADTIGLNVYSGVGGQMDFIRGAALSKNGKPVIAMPSVTSHGESKIVPTGKKGGATTTTRAHTRYVVTEYGIVDLFGKNLKQRCEAMISIAHPKHREFLYNEAVRRFKHVWNPDYYPTIAH